MNGRHPFYDRLLEMAELDDYLEDQAIRDEPFPSAFKLCEHDGGHEVAARLDRVRPERPKR